MDFRINRKYNPIVQLKLLGSHTDIYSRVLIHISIFSVIFFLIVQSTLATLYSGRIYEDPKNLNDTQYAIIFGASVDENGNPTRMLEDRVLSGVDLYKNGKVQRILISGNSKSANFDEVKVMRDILKRNDIPDFVILEDGNSERTYDTCYNAKTEFKINQAILVTQRFHLPRALYLCNSLGVESDGFTADLSVYDDLGVLKFRERFALIKAFLDISILRPIRPTE